MNNLRSILVLALTFCLPSFLNGQENIIITDADLEARVEYQWTANNTYFLDGIVYLKEGATLTIEAGTIIRGVENPTDGEGYSALIVAQDATINAKGEVCNPIIFTYDGDDLVNLDSPGKWGGLIVLGRAPINVSDGVLTSRLLELDRGDNAAVYGGEVEADNSGVLTYVSIRYAGKSVRERSFPGLLLAGVGSGTQVDHVEVFNAGTVGIGMYGGRVNTKYLVAAFHILEAFNYTEGYQGFGQFHFGIHRSDFASGAIEHRGGSSLNAVGVSQPIIYNATLIGAGEGNTDNLQASTAALSFNQESAGEYVNSVFADFSGFGLFIQDIGDGGLDSYTQLRNGNLQLKSNLWAAFQSFSGSPSLSNLIQADPGGDEGIETIVNHLTGEGNAALGSLEGLISGISRVPNNQLDPRPTSLSPPFQTTQPTLDDPFFDAAPYRGAFNEDIWIKGWTALDFYKYLPECDLEVAANTTDIQCFGETGSINLEIIGNVTDVVIDWDEDAFDGQVNVENVQAGVYNVTVTNAECCEQQLEVVVNGPSNALVVDCSNTQEASGPGEADGAITITTSGGGAPESLLLTRPDGTQETRSFADGSSLLITGLEAGEYNAAVTDSFGCTSDCDFIIGAPPCFIIQDDDLVAGGTYTWTADNCYIIDGLVFLESTGSLTIEPGTIIQGRPNPTTGQNTSALIIAKGANIDAQGTEVNPIIFTTETGEDVSPDDLTADDKGLWGGLAILGDAEIPNPDNDGGERFWEVLNEIGGAGQYGGFSTQNVTRNLSYVSVRHAGAAILPNQVFPALTFAAVRETAQLDHLEVFAAADRGIAFYSGTAQLAYASATFCEGPAFSWQDGYSGKGQFWFALSDPGSTNLIADHRGYINDATQDTVASAPQIYNATYIGGGGTGNTTAVAMRFRESSAGVYGNSIFTHFNGNALEVEDIAGDNNDSQSLMEAEEDLFLRNNLFWGFGALDTIRVNDGFLAATAGASDLNATFLVQHLLRNRNKAVDPKLRSITSLPNGQLDPRPEDCAAFNSMSKYPEDSFFQRVEYKGAFISAGNSFWANQWTAVGEKGYYPSVFDVIDSTTCILSLAPGDAFISESPESMPEDEVVDKYEEYDDFAELKDDCKCGTDSIPRLTLWEALLPTEVTNSRGEGQDSAIIDTSGLKVIFELNDPKIETPGELIICSAIPIDQPNESIRIAVIDSGIDFRHSDLSDFGWRNPQESAGNNGIDDDDNCYVDDLHGVDFLGDSTRIVDKDGHGTHLSGIITREYPPNLEPQLMNLKIYEKGDSSRSQGTVFDLICAIRYAIENNAEVINLSIGYWSPEPSIPLYRALKKTEELGIPVVISMGNDSTNIDESRLKELIPREGEPDSLVYEYRWPVQYKVFGEQDTIFPNLGNLISVGSVNDVGDDFAAYSNFGATTLDISTIGAFYSTFPVDTFEAFEGTSMSAAAISQLVSVAKGINDSLSVSDIKSCLSQSIIVGNSSRAISINLPVKRIDPEAFYQCVGISSESRGIIPITEPPDDDVRPIHKKQIDDVLEVRIGDGTKFYESIVMEVKRITGGTEKTVYTLRCAGGKIVWNCRLKDGTELPNGQYFLRITVNGKTLSSVVGNIVKQ